MEIPDKDNNILRYNQEEKFMRIPFIIYADFECLLEKNALMSNNLEKPCTEKNTKHTLSGYSLFTNCLFDATKNN